MRFRCYCAFAATWYNMDIWNRRLQKLCRVVDFCYSQCSTRSGYIPYLLRFQRGGESSLHFITQFSLWTIVHKHLIFS